ncbi:FtsK/SpoIIIE domain-containing protein [Streptomyces sp. 5-6(2022)]|uniref:FtsK/SpoIIIE domain-containing protein n=1 Tax=Streptomyces sp. 5-6(2022) TaxID=2936510 RepID=UPI0023B8A373|nr:FtsK/SpoIIIE domain-containing protein [Streptomyces sp. 5-6(2022)]
MQIRLTVLGPRSAHPGRSGHHPAPASGPHALTAAVDVLVTAPVGTALAAVASGLADAVAAAGYEAGGGGGGGGGAVVLYAGGERLDPQRCALGEPPLVDGAVLSLHGPADPDSDHYPGYPGLPESAVADATVHLDVVAGPDAGGVHLLHGGQVRIGRSADADVPLDDPDVSRLHCAVTVAEDGRVTIADLGSTNGTAADGVPVGPQPVPLEPGALLRIGESALRLRVPSRASAIPSAPTRLPVQADGEGHLRVTPAGDHPTHAKAPWTGAPQPTAPTHTAQGPWTPPARHPGTGWTRVAGPGDESHAAHERAGAHGSDDGWGPGEAAAPAPRGDAGTGTPGGASSYGRRNDDGWGPGAGPAPGPRGEAAGRGRGRQRPSLPGDRPTHDDPRLSPGAPGDPGPGHAQDVRADWGPGAPASRGAGAAGQRSPGAPEDTGYGPAAADVGHRGGEGGDAARRGQPYDDPSTARTRRSERTPGAGAAGQGPAGQPARADQDRPGTGGSAHPGHGPRPTGSRHSDTPQDHRPAPRGTAGDPAGPGGAPYDGAAAGRDWPDEAGADNGDARRGGRPGAGPRSGFGSGGTDFSRAGHDGAPADFDPRGGRPRAAGTGSGGAPGRRGAGERTHGAGYALDAPGAQARRRGIGAWVRQLAGGKAAERGGVREDRGATARAAAEAEALQRRWPDPATLLMTALGPGSRLWERAPGHPDALTVRLGSADQLAPDGGLLPAAPVTVDLRQCGSLGLAGPRARVAGLARSVVAQLAALHSPAALEIVLISGEERLAEWSWLGWLPHVQPLRGQDCRLLLAYDAEQATARTEELTRRLEDGPLGPGWASASPAAARSAAARHFGPYTVVVVDGTPGPAALHDTLARLAVSGSAAGIHLLGLAEAPAASPTSPLPMSYEAARSASAAFAACGVAAVLSGDVATGLQIVHGDGVAPGTSGVHGITGATGATTTVTVDAVSAAWAERFARALAPLRPATSAQDGAFGGSDGPPTVPLPDSARLLDELGLARATPASLLARWAAAADEVPAGGRALAVLGAGPRGPLTVDLAAEGPHALIDGAAGTGKTELLRSFAASLAAAERPDRLELILVDGAGSGAGAGAGAGEGLRVCTDLPHVSTHLAATDPVRMREFAQALSSELKRRAELLGQQDFTTWHDRPHPDDGESGDNDGATGPGGTMGANTGASRASGPGAARAAGTTGTSSAPGAGAAGTPGAARSGGGPGTTGATGASGASGASGAPGATSPGAPRSTGTSGTAGAAGTPGAAGAAGTPSTTRAARTAGAARVVAPRPPGDIDPPPSDTLRTLNLRAQRTASASATRPRSLLPRLVVIVDDFDALVAPALGSPGRPAAGSVVRALEAIARDGARLGVHLVVASGRPDRTADTVAVERAALRIALDARPLDARPLTTATPAHPTAPTQATQTTHATHPTHPGEPPRPHTSPAASTRSVTTTPAAAAAPGGDPAPGRGRLFRADDAAGTPFQAGRVTGRIPRTATQRPTVVPLEWRRMGDPPARRPLRELGNGPTDLALLASALQRAAQSADAPTAPALI